MGRSGEKRIAAGMEVCRGDLETEVEAVHMAAGVSGFIHCGL
jgi:hypothetical protein